MLCDQLQPPQGVLVACNVDGTRCWVNGNVICNERHVDGVNEFQRMVVFGFVDEHFSSWRARDPDETVWGHLDAVCPLDAVSHFAHGFAVVVDNVAPRHAKGHLKTSVYPCRPVVVGGVEGVFSCGRHIVWRREQRVLD